jgi:antitoxin (DNA-binding transcriptional repressor) of toxin-antitoxin stability system
MQVTAAYAKANLSELLKAVEKGETIEITRYNKPVATLVRSTAVQSRPAPVFGTAPDTVKIVDPDWAKPMTVKQMKRLLDTGTY